MNEPSANRLRHALVFGAGSLIGAATVLLVLVVQRHRQEPRDEYGEMLSMICGRVHDHAERALKQLSTPGAERGFDNLFREGYTDTVSTVIQVQGDAVVAEFCGARTSVTSPDFSHREYVRYVKEILSSVHPYTGGPPYPPILGSKP